VTELKFVQPARIWLKNDIRYSEAWLRDRIVETPTILGLGEIEVKDIERMHPKAGRLDLLLRDPESGRRYEVEIMLGTVDESHIIRAVEYWDIERKRYPQYDHCAVIVAENITARFLNVISLFNGAIPIIAIQLNALQVENCIVLNFTKVLDEISLGLDDEEEDAIDQPADRSYWEKKGSVKSLKVADECLGILREVSPTLNLAYKRNYIGLTEQGRANNFVLFRAKKQFLRVEVVITDQAAWSARLEETGLEILEGVTARKRMVFRLTHEELTQNRALLKELFTAAYQEQQD